MKETCQWSAQQTLARRGYFTVGRSRIMILWKAIRHIHMSLDYKHTKWHMQLQEILASTRTTCASLWNGPLFALVLIRRRYQKPTPCFLKTLTVEVDYSFPMLTDATPVIGTTPMEPLGEIYHQTCNKMQLELHANHDVEVKSTSRWAKSGWRPDWSGVEGGWKKKKGGANMCKGSIACKIVYIAKRSVTIRQLDTKTQLYP